MFAFVLCLLGYIKIVKLITFKKKHATCFIQSERTKWLVDLLIRSKKPNKQTNKQTKQTNCSAYARFSALHAYCLVFWMSTAHPMSARALPLALFLYFFDTLLHDIKQKRWTFSGKSMLICIFRSCTTKPVHARKKT